MIDISEQTMRNIATVVSTAIIYYFKAVKPKLLNVRSKSKDHEKLDFISSLLAFGFEKRHPFVVENSIKLYFGKSVPYEVIACLFSARNPLTAFNLYLVSRWLLVFKDGKFEFRKGYRRKRSRSIHKIIALILYSLCASAGIMTFLYSPSLSEASSPYVLLPLGSISIFLILFGMSLLDAAATIDSAVKLIDEMEKEPLFIK